MASKITIGCSPWGENCAQLGQPGYVELAQRELKAFKAQLERHFAAKHNGAKPTCHLVIVGNEHDYGTYYDVQASYRNGTEEVDAFWLESNTPENWDATATAELNA
jgi:hypothetical protein